MSQYNSNINNTVALTTAIVESFSAPTNISASQVQDLVVSEASSRRNRRYLQTSTSSILASYQIVTNSQYSSSAYSEQLSDSVSTGKFVSNLQTASKQLDASFENVTSSTVTIGMNSIIMLMNVFNSY